MTVSVRTPRNMTEKQRKVLREEFGATGVTEEKPMRSENEEKGGWLKLKNLFVKKFI